MPSINIKIFTIGDERRKRIEYSLALSKSKTLADLKIPDLLKENNELSLDPSPSTKERFHFQKIP